MCFFCYRWGANPSVGSGQSREPIILMIQVWARCFERQSFYSLFSFKNKAVVFRSCAAMPCEPNVADGVLQVKKLTEHATVPTKGSSLAAGFDLYSAYDYVIPPMGKELVKTDIQIKVPHGTYGRVAPRSGLAHKSFIDVGAGVIDQDYRGNVGIILFNFGKTEFQVRKGDRVAQLICEKISYPKLEEVQDLDETVRGEGGFGSTGKC